jgi:beta-galactosidase
MMIMSIRKLMSVLALGMMCVQLRAQQAPLPPEIEDPECLGINKEPAHATLMPYANLKEALAANRRASSQCLSLNGPWKFNWVAHPAQRPVDFYKVDFDASGWKEIPVPSCWQLLGYGTPYYRNAGYTFQKDWPHVMSEPPRSFTAYNERNPVGSYRREFEVPADWAGRRIFLNFAGVDSAFYLWINGQKAGFSVNSRNAAEFDITRYVQPGKNLVAAEVYRYCAGSYIEDQDMWRLSGIFRDVTLWSSPEVHVRDFFVKTDLDAQYLDATVSVAAKIRNYSDKPAPARELSVRLYDLNGQPLTGSKGEVAVPALQAGEEKSVTVSIPVSNPDKWTAETPNLYTTVLTLSGERQEILSARTGFRKIEIKGRVYTINGVPVKLKGANRHENWPDTGHYVSEERMKKDLEVLKQGNCNHVRTCHYSDDPRWYELCDEWGIYLTAEANCECHGYYGVLDREPKYRKAIVDRSVANVENFKNHASVVMWSLGNECGGGNNFDYANQAVKQLDRSRPTHYEAYRTNHNPTDVDSQMYTHPYELAKIAQDDVHYSKPFYMCEYAHAMFNSMGSIGDYNDVFDKYPSLMGGAIWEWEDQGIYNRRDPKHPILAYGGGFGEEPNDHYFIHKGVIFSDRSPKPHYPEMKRVYQWIAATPVDLSVGTVKVRNKYAFISLSGFKGKWTVTEDGKVIQKGALPRLNTPAGSEVELAVPLKNFDLKWGAIYHLNLSFELAQDEVWAKAGYEVARMQFDMTNKFQALTPEKMAVSPLTLDEQGGQITVTGKRFSVVFDKALGTITQIARDGKNVLVDGGGPRLQLWRAPHRNDDMWAYRDWHNYGLDALQFKTVSVKAEKLGPGAVRVETVVEADGKRGFSATHAANYTVYSDGSIAVDNAVAPQGRRIPLARVGVRLQMEKLMDQFEFLGRGPMENYSDRKRGSDVGLYSSSVKEQMTPYEKPMECGNHEDVRWAAVSGGGFPTIMVQSSGLNLQVSAIPYTDEVMTPIEYVIDLPASKSTVLTVSGKTLGAGSAGCGPRPLEPYMVYAEPTEFSYVLRILPSGQHGLPEAGRLGVPADRVKPAMPAGKVSAMPPKSKVIASSSFEQGEGRASHAVDGVRRPSGTAAIPAERRSRRISW